MKFKQNTSSARQAIRIPPAVKNLSGLHVAKAVEFHILDGGVAVTKADMSAMDIVNLIAALSNLLTDFAAQIGAACGVCDHCGYCQCFCGDEPVRIPEYVLKEAGICPGSKLKAVVDDTGTITVEEADYTHDLSDVPPDILEIFRKSGVCIHELEERLMADDIIYTGTGQEAENG